MIVLNFSHPITRKNVAQIRTLTGKRVSRVIDIPVHFDQQQPFIPQVEELMSRIPLSEDDLKKHLLLVNPPALNFIAGLILAHLHGLLGHFPAILRLRQKEGSLLIQFEVAEILNLQSLREHARLERYSLGKEEKP